MSWLRRFLSSSIGMKLLMALTGLMLVGFLIGHLAGNLLVFVGTEGEALDAYAEGLRQFPAVLLIARIGLIAAFLVHIFSAIRLTQINKQARPEAYAMKKSQKATFASQYMGITGVVVLFFVLYHLAHLTMRWTHPEFAELGDFDVYAMMLISFSSPLVTGLYVVSVCLLMVHLDHGLRSLAQTVGWWHTNYNQLFDCASKGLSTILAVGFISGPVAIYLGLI